MEGKEEQTNLAAALQVQLQRSGNITVRRFARRCNGQIRNTLRTVPISAKMVVELTSPDLERVEAAVRVIFRSGWLDPNGGFCQVEDPSRVEDMVEESTGYAIATEALERGWIKILLGLPYGGAERKNLFEHDDLPISKWQAIELRDWFRGVAEEEKQSPVFAIR